MSITLLTGKNSFLIDEKVHQMVADHTKKHGQDSVVRLSGHEIDWGQLSQALQGVSLFESGERLIVVRHISENKSLHEPLSAWCMEHAEQGEGWPVLLLVDESIDKRSNYYKELKKFAIIEDVLVPDETQLTQMLVQAATRLGGKLDTSTARYFVERSDGSQQKLMSELNTLVTYNSEITKENIDLFVAPSLRETIFQLLDYICAGNHELALGLYEQLRQHQTETHYIMTMISWQSSNMALVKAAGQRADDQIAKQASLSPFVVRKTRQLVQRLEVAQLKKWLILAAEADLAIKTTVTPPDQILQTLIAQLCAVVQERKITS